MQARSLCVVLTHNHLPPPRKKLRIERCPLLPFTAHVLTDRPPRALHHVLHSSTNEVGPASHRQLVAYFRSGWAFLIPYLAAYLLYAWLKWPVNPVAAGSSPVDGGQLAVSAIGALPSTVPPSTGTPSTAHSLLSTGVPCLLHVYWFLHALHLVLGALALRAWWQGSILNLQLSTSSPAFHAYSRTRTSAEPRDVSKHQQGTGAPSAHLPPALRSSASSEVGSTVYRLLPWVLLALLFYIPGVYLEWPSDPWEHLRRINEWRVLDTVTAHSSWVKSSYFIPYSLLSWATGLRQIFWLDFYYTGICLLLCWQYYRLARACDLSERASFVFVLFNALIFGNNIFSFYRYYGLSSSIFAQLGAVALTRIVLESARGTPVQNDGRSLIHRIILLLAPCSLLLVLTAFNHIQGLGITGLGILAVIVWRLIGWKRSATGWLALAAVLLSVATALWFPRHPALDETYRPEGWLTAWYGFNLFSSDSPAWARSMQILGIIGVLNLFMGFWLVVRQNHIVGWLTLMPVIVLVVPCFALPLASILATQSLSPGNIITFHRFLLAIPTGMALAVFVAQAVADYSTSRFSKSKDHLSSAFLGCGLAVLVVFGPVQPRFNRIWDILRKPPSDLEYRATLTGGPWDKVPDDSAVHFVGNETSNYILSSLHPELWQERFANQARIVWSKPARTIESVMAKLVTAPASLRSNIAPLNLDPHFMVLDAWRIQPSRDTVELVRISDFSPAAAAVQNRAGEKSELLCSEPIRISQTKLYKIEVNIRRRSQANAATLLMVAWYDDRGAFLPSFLPMPEGAGTPAGWENGTYSYFGLAGQNPPQVWTTYRTSFGLGGSAVIPPHAAFVRIGLLLNNRQFPGGQVQATNFLLWEAGTSGEPADGVISPTLPRQVYLNSPQRTYTNYSQAGYLSGHWLPMEVALLSSGYPELSQAARRTTHYYYEDRMIIIND